HSLSPLSPPESRTSLSLTSSMPPAALPSPLSLHDALPILPAPAGRSPPAQPAPGAVHRRRDRQSVRAFERPGGCAGGKRQFGPPDRKSTRLNSSHVSISYAVFCLKKKTRQEMRRGQRRWQE